MMFGQEVNMPVDILMGLPMANQRAQEPGEYLMDLDNILRDAFSSVRKSLKAVQVRQKRQYDAKLHQCIYSKGDFVYKVDSSTKVGQSTKLRPVYQGPYLVSEVISDALYRIEDRKKSVVAHHDKLTRCTDRHIPFWLRRKRHLLLDLEEVSAEQTEQGIQVSPDTGVAGFLVDGLNLAELFSPGEMSVTSEEGVDSGQEARGTEGVEVRGNEENEDDEEGGNEVTVTNEDDEEGGSEVTVVNDEQKGRGNEVENTRRGRAIKPPRRFQDYVLE
jgi:hypothetical protein